MVKPEPQNCIEIIRPYIHAVTQEGMPNVQLLGGVGSVALLNPETVIKQDEKRIIAPADIALSNYRDDGNLRDVETLVTSTKQSDIDAVQACGESTIGNKLIVETFAFRDTDSVQTMLAKPLGKKAVFMFVSDRYMQPDTQWTPESNHAQRVLFPFSTPISADALETWTLQIGEELEIPVPAPGAIIINYLTRSISGLRTKDAKLHEITKTVVDKAPQTVEWIIDGPGSSQYDLARVLHTLREPKHNPHNLTVGENLPVELVNSDLANHQTFMFKDETSAKLQTDILKIAKLKSRGLHIAESAAPLVTVFQRYVEPRIGAILHNK